VAAKCQRLTPTRTWSRVIAVLLSMAMVAVTMFVATAPDADAMPTPIVVTTTLDVVANDGNCSLREAIATADDQTPSECGSGNPGLDIINLTASTYLLTSSLPNIDDGELVINGNGATIDGNDSATIMIVGADLTLHDLTLTRGDGGATPAGAMYMYGGAVVTLDNVDVTNNTATAGGGISVERGTLLVTNGSAISNNSATSATTGNGGGIYILSDFGSASVVQITDSEVSNNSAVRPGGGIYFGTATTATIERSLITGNTANDGGGIYNRGALSVTDSTISANDASSRGGGLYNAGILEINGSTVSSNDSSSDSGLGGGIYSDGAAAVTSVSSSTIAENIADGGGGGFYVLRSRLILNDVDVVDNTADFSSRSAIHILAGNPRVEVANSRFENNTIGLYRGTFAGTGLTFTNASLVAFGGIAAVHESMFEDGTIQIGGGGSSVPVDVTISSSSVHTDDTNAVYAYAGSQPLSLTIENSTLVADGSGAGLEVEGILSSVRVIHSTIVGGTGGGMITEGSARIGGSIVTAAPGADAVSVSGAGGVTSGSYNVIGPTSRASDFNATDLVGVTDAGLEPLSMNAGGTTMTFALTPSSPARDFVAGPLINGLTSPAADQNGTARPIGAFADAGAYEAPLPNTAPVAANDSASTGFETAVTVNVVDGSAGGADTDADGDALTVSGVTGFSNGTATRSGATITYTPATGFVGTDTGTYTVSDSNGGTDTAALTVTVTAPPALCNGLAVTHDLNFGASSTGTAGDDVFLGTAGPDTIDGLAGDDTICGEGGNDTLNGGDGKDFIFGGDGNDMMTGGLGNDRIRGNAGEDNISGDAGNDFLYGGIDADTINGGAGNDTMGGFGGPDTINGGAGNDKIFGGFGPDTINGGDGDDRILGLVGDDIINGNNGNDELNGDNGQDTINGGAGNDIIKGGNSLDTLLGGTGDDNLAGGKSDDTLSGGPGTDTCTGNTEATADTADTTCETTFGIP